MQVRNSEFTLMFQIHACSGSVSQKVNDKDKQGNSILIKANGTSKYL